VRRKEVGGSKVCLQGMADVLFLLPVACLWCDGRKEQWIHSALRYNRWMGPITQILEDRKKDGAWKLMEHLASILQDSTRLFYVTFYFSKIPYFRSECRRTLVPTDRRTLVPVGRRTTSERSIKDRRDLLFVTGLNDGQCVFFFCFRRHGEHGATKVQ